MNDLSAYLPSSEFKTRKWNLNIDVLRGHGDRLLILPMTAADLVDLAPAAVRSALYHSLLMYML